MTDLSRTARHALVAIGTCRRYENDVNPPDLAQLIDMSLVEVIEGGPVRDRGLCVLTDAGITVVSLLIEKKRKRAA